MKNIIIYFGLVLLSISYAKGTEEHAFTVDFNSIVKKKEYCRPFKNLKGKNAAGDPFEKWCKEKGKAVYLCSGVEKFYLFNFPDKPSCNTFLEVLKFHSK